MNKEEKLERWAKIEAMIRPILENLKKDNSNFSIELVEDFLENNELGLALETIVSSLGDNLSKSDISAIIDTAKFMGYDNSEDKSDMLTWQTLMDLDSK